MGFFSNFVEGIQDKIRESSQRKKEEQEFLRRMRIQSEQERRLTFEEEYKKNARLVAIAKAKEEAAKKSGIQKLRALNRAQRLQEGVGDPNNFFEKLASYTQKNLVKREENIKRTAEQREMAKNMREQRLVDINRQRQQKMAGGSTKPFGSGKTWGS